MTQKQHIILKHLDAPIRILSFSLNDLLLYALPIFIGSFLDDMFVIPLVGLLTVFSLKRVCQRIERFYLINMLYWYLPTTRYNRLFKTQLIPSEKRIWMM